MTDKEIQRLRTLLDQFYIGEDTEETDEELFDLLDRRDLPVEFITDRLTVRTMILRCPPPGVEQRMSELIDSLAAEGRTEKRRRHIPWRRYIPLAAAVALLIGVGTVVMRHTAPQHTLPAEMTPEEIYASADRALSLFGSALEKGCAGIETAEAAKAQAQILITRNIKDKKI